VGHGAGAISYGFPAVADTAVPNILPTGITQYEHVVSMPFDDIPGHDDMERAERLVQRCIEVRGIKIKVASIKIPVAYGPAFEARSCAGRTCAPSSAARMECVSSG